jgi:hypothetical protein
MDSYIENSFHYIEQPFTYSLLQSRSAGTNDRCKHWADNPHRPTPRLQKAYQRVRGQSTTCKVKRYLTASQFTLMLLLYVNSAL